MLAKGIHLGKSHIEFRTQCVIMMVADGGIFNDVLI